MSTTVDQRVVEMRFDNRHFERNVSTTMSTLGKLKQSLNLPDASKSLNNLGTAAKKVDMNGLANGVENVRMRFSALEVIGVTALANITNSAVNAGKRIVSALTIDPVKTGFQEYETQINAVQTILANTKSKGTTIDDVNQALDELNKYADMTIYNFTEMTRNIGTFTAAGVDLETSVGAIQGIANLAAVSGSTSQQASTAMYQLSQALAAGKVQLMDWNSVVNAGMGGEMFQNALRETSELLGTGAEAAIKAKGSFRESLREGWLTSEVLTETLKKFTTSGANEYVAEYTELSIEAVEAAVQEGEAISKAAKARGDEVDAIEHAAEALAKKSGKDKEEIYNMLDFARSATDAATKVKTFTQLWDVLKESAQSGWSQTWKLIIGDFEEAKSLLTPLADTLTGFINKMSDWRNSILQVGLDFAKPWTAMMKKLDGAGLDKIKKVAESVGDLSDKLEYYQNVVNKVWRGDYKNSDTGRFELLEADGYNYKVVQDLVNKGYEYKLTVEDIEESHKKFGVAVKSSEKEVKKTTASLDKLSDQKLKDAGLTEEEIRLYRALEQEADKQGTTISKLAKQMSEVSGRDLLIDSFKNFGDVIVGIGKAAKTAWDDVFNPPGVEVLGIELYGVINSLNEFSEKIRLTDEKTGELTKTGEKIKRTFAGVFAVVDIVATILGGPLKLAFTVATKLLGMFGYGILDVTAIIGDTLVGVHDFIEGIFNLDKLLEPVAKNIETAAKAFKEWFDGLKDAENLPKYIANGVAKGFKTVIRNVKTFLKSIRDLFKNGFTGFDDSPIAGFVNKIKNGLGIAADTIVELGKIALNAVNSFLTAHGFEEISMDCIAGLVNGLKNGAANVWNAAVAMAKGIVQKVCDFLGIESPSTVFMAIGGFIIAGLIAGLQNGIPDSLGAIKDVIQPILDWIKGLDFGAIMAAVIGISTARTAYKAVNAFAAFASPLEGLGELFESTGEVLKKSARPIKKILNNTAKVVKSFSKVLNATAFSIRMDGIKTLATSILMLAAAVAILSLLDTKKLWSSVGVIAALSVILVALAFVMDKLNGASISFKDGLNIKGLTTGLAGIGIALLLMATTVKMIGSLNPDQAKQGFLGLLGLILAIAAVTAVFGIFVKGKSAQNIDKFGKTMTKIAIALLLMSVVVKMLGGMDQTTLEQGGKAIAQFVILIAGLMAATKLIGRSSNVSGIGGTLLKIALAIGVMTLVAKALGEMDRDTLMQGTLAIIVFGGIIVGLMAATKLISRSKRNVGEIGGTLLKIAAAIGVMALVAKMLGGMDTKELVKGGLAAVAFAGIIVGLMAATRLIGGNKNIGKIGVTLLSISGAIAIMAATAFMLSMISWEGFAKGTIMVTAFAGIVVGLIAATRLVGGNDIEKLGKTILMIAGAIASLALIAVLMSLVPVENLKRGLAIVSVLSLLMAGLIAVTGLSKNCLGNIIAITVAIAVITGAVYMISKIPAESAITSAVILGGLMVAMTGVLAALSLIGKSAKNALLGVLLLTAMAIPLLAFVKILEKMQNVQIAIASVKALIILTAALTVLLIPLALIGTFATNALLGVLALTTMAIPLLAFVGVLALMSGIQNGIENAKALTELMTAIGDVLFKISLVAPLAIMGVGALAGMLGLITALGVVATAIGALVDKFPSLEEFLNKGIGIFEDIAYGLGSAIGNFIAGIGETISASLPTIGQNIADFMDKLALASDNASGIESGAFDGVVDLIEVLAGIAVASVGTTIADKFTELIGETSTIEKFQTDCVAFINAMTAVSEAASGAVIDETAIEVVSNAGMLMASLQNALPKTGGWLQEVVGEQDLVTFGASCIAFGKAIVDFSKTVSGDNGIDVDAARAAADAGTVMASLQNALPKTGGWLQEVVGEQDLVTFGASCIAFGKAIVDFSKSVSGDNGIDVDAAQAAADAGTIMTSLQSALPKTGGWLQEVVGEQDLATFGATCVAFGKAIVDFSKSVSGDNAIDVSAAQAAADAGIIMAELQNALPKTGGWLDDIVGESDLADFGDKIAAFGTAITDFSTTASEINSEGIDIAINTAYRIKSLISALTDLDMSGVEAFTGVGTGGIGADGPMSDIADAISTFSTKVAGIDNTAVSTSVTAATRLKNLITSLVGIDTSGIESFKKAKDIGSAIGDYADNIGDIDTGTLSSSISAANRLKNFINGLADIDNSGISKFKLTSIGSTMKSYINSVKDIDASAVSSSISAANRLKNFIDSLADLDTSGVGSFTESVNKLGTVSVDTIVSAFGNSTTALNTAGSNLILAVANGMSLKQSTLATTVTTIIAGLYTSILTKTTSFMMGGVVLMTNFASGMLSKKSSVSSAMISSLSSATSSARGYYMSFYNAGSYLVSGFVNGISANAYKATAKARAMATAAKNAAEAALGIASPSKVFYKIGMYTGQGFVNALTDYSDKTYAAGSEMAISAKNGLNDAIGKIADFVSSDMDIQPTIRPVLDMSDVESGARNIGNLFGSGTSVGLQSSVGSIATSMNRRLQNRGNDDIVSAIEKLRSDMSNIGGTSYNINGLSYNEGSDVAEAFKTIIRSARQERRI